MRPVNERPQWPTGIRPTPSSLTAWGEALIRQLVSVFQEFGYRLNHVLPKDGSEALEGDLDMGGFNISNTPSLGTAAKENIGTSGANVPLLNGNNVWSAPQTIDNVLTVAGTGGGDITFANSNATNEFQLNHRNVGTLDVVIDGATRWAFGASYGFYSAGVTGRDKGPGSINAAAVYDDNVLLTCYAIDAYKTGSVDIAYWDSVTPDLDVPAQPEQVKDRPVTQKVMRTQRVRDGARIVERLVEVDEPIYDELPVFDEAGQPVRDADGKPLTDRVLRTERVVTAPAQPARTEVRTHAPAAKFAPRAAELLDPKAYGESWKATGHLPAMPSPAEWAAAGKKMAIGDLVQRLWETVEVQAVHIDKLLQRIEALEATRRTP